MEARSSGMEVDSMQINLFSERANAIINKNPKAQTHFLVLPKISIDSIFKLEHRHLPLLEDMLQLANRVIAKQELKENDFVFGFKLDGRVQGLAMHVVSKDFMSEHLFTKRQWNSFHTRIFMPYKVAYASLKVSGIINPVQPAQLEAMFDSPLHCNQCEFETTSICMLKVHLSTHWQNKTQQTTEKATKPETKEMQAKLDTASVLPSSLQVVSLDEMLKKLSTMQQGQSVQKKPQNLEPIDENSKRFNLDIKQYKWYRNQKPSNEQQQQKMLPPQNPQLSGQSFAAKKAIAGASNSLQSPNINKPPYQQKQSYRYQQPNRYNYQQHPPLHQHRQPLPPVVNRKFVRENANTNSPNTQSNPQQQAQLALPKENISNPLEQPNEKSEHKYYKYHWKPKTNQKTAPKNNQ